VRIDSPPGGGRHQARSGLTSALACRGLRGALVLSMPQWYVYLVRCSDGALYTGIATDVSRRFTQHQQSEGKGAKYLRGKGPLQLVFKKAIGRRGLALRVEGQIKRLPKGRKEELIEQDDMIKQMVTQAKKELFRRVGVS